MRGKMKKLWIYDAAVVALVCLGGLHCELYQKISGPRIPDPVQPAPAGTVTIGGRGDFDRILSIQETSDKGFIIGGYVNTNGFQGLIIRTNKSGDTLWSKTTFVNPVSFSRVTSIKEIPGQGYQIIANTEDNDSGYVNVGMLKTDLSGNYVWQKTLNSIGKYVNDCGYCGGIFKKNTSVAITPDFGFVVMGTHFYDKNNIKGSWIYKINNSSDTIYENLNIDTSGNLFGSIIECVSDGSVITATRNDTIFLMKLDINGIVLWESQLKVTFQVRNVWAHSIKQTADNGIIIAGGTNPATDAVRDAFLVKTDGSGNLIWSKTYDGSMGHNGSISDASAQSLLPTPDGGVVVLGITTANMSMNLRDVWLFKVNANGDTLWSRSFGGGNDDYGMALAPTSDGGFIIGASTESYGNGASDIWLIKTDASGNLVPLK
jgi:hypothetical protein